MPEVGEIIRSEKTGRLGRFLGDGRVELLSPGQQVTSPKTGRVGRITQDNKIELIDQQEEERPGFSDRLKKDAERRGQIGFEIISAKAQGEQSWGETLYQLASQGAGMAMDTVWNGMVTAATGAGKAVSAITPDIIEDPAKDFATYAGHFMLNAAEKTGAIRALEDGQEAYQQWKEKNPRAARNVEATVNLGLFFAPIKGKGASQGKSVVDDAVKRPTLLGRAANRIDDSIPARAEKLKREFVEDLMRPVDSKRNMQNAVSNRKMTAGSFFTDKKYLFDRSELSAIDDIVKSTSVNRGDTIQKVWDAAIKRVDDIEKDIQKAVTGSRKRYNKKDFLSQIDNLRTKTLADNSALIIGENKRAVSNMFEYAKKLTRKYDNTPKGILQARREFTKWAKSQVSEKALYDPDTLDTAKSIANRVIREGFEEQLGALDDTIKPMLMRQSSLLRATGKGTDAVLTIKAAAEPDRAIARQWQKVTQIIGLRSEFNNTMASLFGVGGLGAAALFAPFYTAGLGLATTKYVGSKLLFSKQTKKILSTLIRGTDTAIDVASKSPGSADEIISSLKADRAVIQQLLDEGLFEK